MDLVHENMGTTKHLSGRRRLNDVGNTHDLLHERAAHSESSLYDTTDKSHEQNESPVYVEYL